MEYRQLEPRRQAVWTEEVTQVLEGAQKIVSWIPDIELLEFEFCFWL